VRGVVKGGQGQYRFGIPDTNGGLTAHLVGGGPNGVVDENHGLHSAPLVAGLDAGDLESRLRVPHAYVPIRASAPNL
jgi:hypothetical protein